MIAVIGPKVIFNADASVIAQTTPTDPRQPPKTKWHGFLRFLVMSPYKPPKRDIVLIKQPDTLGVFMPARFEPIADLISRIIQYDLTNNTDTYARILEATVIREPVFDLKDVEEDVSESVFHIDDDEKEIDYKVMGLTPFLPSRLYLVSSTGGTFFENGFRATANQVINFHGNDQHRAPFYCEFSGAAKRQTRYLLRLAFRDAQTAKALLLKDDAIYGQGKPLQSQLSINLV